MTMVGQEFEEEGPETAHPPIGLVESQGQSEGEGLLHYAAEHLGEGKTAG